jgi:hypothetical protein
VKVGVQEQNARVERLQPECLGDRIRRLRTSVLQSDEHLFYAYQH